jgi:phage terminase large subunit
MSNANKIQLKLYPFQMELLKALNKFNVVTMAIGRRMGKSYGAALAAVLHCIKAKTENPRRVLIIAPTSDMVKESYWSQLKEFLFLYKPFIQQVREREREITFKNGSIITLKSADKPDTLRGISGKAVVSFVIMDEFSFLREAEKLFEEVIMPYRANSSVQCKFLCISTPKGTGNFFHQMYEKCLENKNGDSVALHYSCYDAQPHLKNEFDKQKNLMTARAFKQEYLAEFVGSGNSAFYAFDRKLHIDSSIRPIQKGETVVIGLDANIGLMTNIVARVKANPDNKSYYIEVISESEGKYKNVDQLITDYNKYYRTELNCPIVVCPDASMAQRAYSASLGVTGMSKLKDAGWLVKAERKNPTYIDSVQAVNQAFLRGDNTINLKIHPSCTKLIHSIEIAQWKEGDGHQLDKTSTSAEGHIQDTLRYLVWQYRTVVPSITIRRTEQF